MTGGGPIFEGRLPHGTPAPTLCRKTAPGHNPQNAKNGVACHASFSTIRKFLRDVVQVTIARSQLAKIIGKVSQALEQPSELDFCPFW